MAFCVADDADRSRSAFGTGIHRIKSPKPVQSWTAVQHRNQSNSPSHLQSDRRSSNAGSSKKGDLASHQTTFSSTGTAWHRRLVSFPSSARPARISQYTLRRF